MPLQIIISLVGCAVTCYGFYTSVSTKAINLQTKISSLEVRLNYAESSIRDNSRKIGDHDQANREILLLAEQIKTLTKSVEELKEDVKNELMRG